MAATNSSSCVASRRQRSSSCTVIGTSSSWVSSSQLCVLAVLLLSSNSFYPSQTSPPPPFASFVEGFSPLSVRTTTRRMDPQHYQQQRPHSPVLKDALSSVDEAMMMSSSTTATTPGVVLDLHDVMDLLPIPPPSELIASSPATSETFSHLTLTWEQDVCDKIKAMYDERLQSMNDDATTASTSPLMCAVVGIPGSGKTTSAAVLADMLAKKFATEQKSSQQSSSACQTLMMPFDGYHIPMETLLTMGPEAVYRRGAPDTFDAHRLEETLREIRYGSKPTLAIPGFDHARGDPEDGAHTFDRNQHKIVIVEGLYLLHDHDGWDNIRNYFDVSIYVDANIDVCMDRLKARNKCIPGYTAEEIEVRVDAVDRVNAMTVQGSKGNADIVVQSAAC